MIISCVFFQKLPSRKPPTLRRCDVNEARNDDAHSVPACQDQPAATISSPVSDHLYATMASPRKLKRKLDNSTMQLQLCKQQLEPEHQKTRRLTQKVSNLSSVVSRLEELNLVSSSCAEMLEASFSGVPNQVMQRILKRQQNSKFHAAYPEESKAFAMTLQLYSGKAYGYVRQTFGLALPIPRQIRAWYGGIDGEPGFTKSAFTALQARVESNTANGRETVCALMLDEMAIRRHVEYVNGKLYGYVDVGSGNIDDSTPVARDALLLMVEAVNESWKLAIGYVLVDGMSGQERANLITESLHRFHAVGVSTVSLTCDGPSCHFSAMPALGVNLSMDDNKPIIPSSRRSETRRTVHRRCATRSGARGRTETRRTVHRRCATRSAARGRTETRRTVGRRCATRSGARGRTETRRTVGRRCATRSGARGRTETRRTVGRRCATRSGARGRTETRRTVGRRCATRSGARGRTETRRTVGRRCATRSAARGRTETRRTVGRRCATRSGARGRRDQEDCGQTLCN